MDDHEAFAMARALRPPSFGGGFRGIKDPVVEPLWNGLRVVLGVADGVARMYDLGEPVEGHDDLVASFATTTADTAEDLVVEAWLTRQIVSEDVGVFRGGDEELPSTGEFLGRVLLGSRADKVREAAVRLEAGQAGRRLQPGEPLNLVVVDLLRVDGASLLDVPLQERKRILESVVPAGELIRPGIHVRPPIDSWIGSWRAQGFDGMTFKAANSRYRPGEAARDWATAPMPRR